jgi:hypothetical protein
VIGIGDRVVHACYLVDDVAAEVALLCAAGVGFRCDIALDDSSGNPIEPFTPARAR